MSGGERKKRISQGTGWEEAGGEFYQECYPGGDLDLEALPRDPHYFATLLPSKQTRAATTRRPRADNKATFKRRTSTRSRNCNTMGQNTMPNDIHVAMMPDLSENLANEETTWEEMMLIKTMPITMTQKKEIKAKLLSADTFRLQGLKHLKWKRRKLWEYLKIRWKEFYKTIELWRKCFITIEGNFGSGVVSFFFFLKWLMFLNFTLAILLICFVVSPTLLMNEVDTEGCNSSNDTSSVDCCIQSYRNTWDNMTLNPYSIVEGSGWLESTVMFYGVYPRSILGGGPLRYNLQVAYIATSIACFVLSLYAIMKKAANGFRDRLIENEGQYYRYCSMIFAGWDFCIYNEQSAKIKHQALFSEIKDSLDAERRRDDRKNRTRDEKFRFLSIRLFVHSIVLIICFAAGTLIVFVFQYSMKELDKDFDDDHYKLLLEFSPYLCVVGLNFIVPHILNYLVTLESYSPIFALRITFLRTIILRLASLGTIFYCFYSLIKCSDVQGDSNACLNLPCQKLLCWETFVGQQVYKLLILDILLNTVITFLINFPRMLLAKHVKCKLTRIICAQEFDLSNHLLDVVYSQTLIWFGSFFAPLMPALATVLLFIVFYIKKFACLVNSSPSTTVYRASRSNSMFMSVLLISFCVATIPWALAIFELKPSKSCGPFSGRPSFWSTMEEVYRGFPWWITFIFENMVSSSFAIPAFLILLFTLYYFRVISNANKQMVDVLKKQLVLEGHDKQFLLNRLSAFIKQHQERHKAIRSVDPPSSSN